MSGAVTGGASTATAPGAPTPSSTSAAAAASAGAPEPRVRLALAVLAVVATVLVALLAVALVVRLDADRLPVGAPRDPPAAPPEVTRMTVSGTALTFRELDVSLPRAPYACPDEQPSPLAEITQLVTCSATVHDGFDGAGSDWSAVVGVGLLADDAGTRDDLQATAKDVFKAVADLSFTPADHAKLSEVDGAPVDIGVPDGSYATWSGRVTVTRKGLPTPYDQLVVVVVRLGGGQRVAYFSDFPHDASKQTLAALVESVSSIRTHT